MAWNMPGFVAIRDTSLRLMLQSLERFLSKPRFEQGIELGGGVTYNAGTDSFTYLGPTTLLGGTGVPPASLGQNGNFFFRSDTPGTANQRIYVKSAGAWAGIV